MNSRFARLRWLPRTRQPRCSWQSGRVNRRAAAIALVTLTGACVAACGNSAPAPDAYAGKALNGIELSTAVGSEGYRAVIVGHAYGHFRDQGAPAPAHTLLNNLKRINDLKPSFTLLLGDFVRSPQSRYVVPLRRQLVKRLAGPIFVAPGEHDLTQGKDTYERLFGARYYSLRIATELFLILDSGGAKGTTELSQKQRAFVDTLLDVAAEDPGIRNIVVLMHKVLWVDHPRYRKLRERINNYRPGGFWNALYPELRRLAASKSVYVGAGDIGHLSYSFVVDRDPEDGITYFATGLADRAWDSLAVMHFAATGEVEIRPLSLSARAIDIAATQLDGFSRWSPTDAGVR